MGVGSMDWEEKRGEMGVKGDKRADMGALEIAIQILEIRTFSSASYFHFWTEDVGLAVAVYWCIIIHMTGSKRISKDLAYNSFKKGGCETVFQKYHEIRNYFKFHKISQNFAKIKILIFTKFPSDFAIYFYSK